MNHPARKSLQMIDAQTFKAEHKMLVKNDVRSRNVDMNIRSVAHANNLPPSANGKLRAVVGMKHQFLRRPGNL